MKIKLNDSRCKATGTSWVPIWRQFALPPAVTHRLPASAESCSNASKSLQTNHEKRHACAGWNFLVILAKSGKNHAGAAGCNKRSPGLGRVPPAGRTPQASGLRSTVLVAPGKRGEATFPFLEPTRGKGWHVDPSFRESGNAGNLGSQVPGTRDTRPPL